MTQYTIISGSPDALKVNPKAKAGLIGTIVIMEDNKFRIERPLADLCKDCDPIKMPFCNKCIGA